DASVEQQSNKKRKNRVGAPTSTSAGTTKTLLRDKRVPMMVRRGRDQACLVTGLKETLDVAHIFPWSLRNLKRDEAFWVVLMMFFSKLKVQKWQTAVYKGAQLPVTEVAHNLMTLAKHVHDLHSNCFLAFEPGR